MRTIEIAGTHYPVMVDIAVIAKIQDRYGKMSKLWGKLYNISETLWVLTQLINEADRYQRINGGNGFLDQPMTEEKLGMLMTFEDLTNKDLVQQIINAFNDGIGGQKNLQAGQRKKKPRSGKRKRKKTSSTLPGSNT